MANDWRNVALGDVCQLRAGFVFAPAMQGKSVGNYPFVKVSDMNLASNVVRIQDANNWVDDEDLRQLKAKPFPPGTTVFAKIGEALKANRLRYIIRPTIIDNNMMGAVPAPDIVDSCFFHYALSKFDFGEVAGGSALPYLTVGALSKLEIAIPPLREQRAIAHILGTLDDKIELNRKQNETLEAMARALFKAWFVDFEPVRAKMEGRWQRGQSLPGLPAHLYDIFPDRLVESELGEIPEGWEYIPFGSLLESTIGGDWGKDVPEDDHNQVVSIIRGTDFPDVSSGGIGKVPTRYTTTKKLASRQLQAGDIVLEISGGSPTQPTGRSIFISESTLERFSNAVVCASFCRRFQPKNSELGALAFMHLQHLYAVGGTWEYQNQSTGIANFHTTRFLEHEMVVAPSAALLRVFAAQANTLLNKMSSNESLSLAQLRDTLLPKLISGELRVPDAEAFLRERGL